MTAYAIRVPAGVGPNASRTDGNRRTAGIAGRDAAFRPGELVDRKAIAKEIEALLAGVVPPPEDAGKSEEEIMNEILDDIAEYRRERRSAASGGSLSVVRVVIDCNVLVSAARSRGVCRRVVNEAVASHGVVLSEPVLAEYETVASRPKHERYRDRLLNLVRLLRNIATMVEPADTIFGLADPDDEIYLATATAGRAALVTGNRRHFTEAQYGPVEVLSPRAFLDRMAA